MLIQEDFKAGAGVVIEESETEVYIGYPELGTSSINDRTWAIQRIMTTDKTTTYMWANGTAEKVHRMSDYKNIPYNYLQQ